MDFDGISVEKDYNKAFKLFLESRKEIYSQEMLAKCYMYGFGTKKDEKKAFDIYNDSSSYSFNIGYLKNQQVLDYTNLKNVQSFDVNGVYIYVFENKDKTTIEFTNNGYHYYIVSDVPFNDISSLVKTIK